MSDKTINNERLVRMCGDIPEELMEECGLCDDCAAMLVARELLEAREKLARYKASHEELVKALEKIHQHPGNKSRCECEDHSSPDCCSQADRDFFCPDCIAGAALESARKVNG